MARFELAFQLPPYAKGMLWLAGANGFQAQVNASPAEIPAFSEESPLMLRWGTPDGSLLAMWTEYQPIVRWDGQLRIGGHVEISHLLVIDDLEWMIVEVTGKPLASAMVRLPSLAALRQAPFQRPIYFSYDDTPDYWYAFLLPLENPLSDFAHHALVNGHAVDCYATFAAQKAGLHKVIGMPFVLESMTLYGT